MGMKGHPQSNSGGAGGGGGGGGGGVMKKVRMKKMAMVVVVILVGVMGVMVVQKLRDRRIFNLLIKDKDRQILSLHLLLQKERQYAKETKRKNQDLNAKLYSLRTDKIQLNNKILEMQSTITSMRDEQRALELAIDEKQNQINHTESLIKDLRTNLQIPPKIWSVSSDDPSNRELNSTTIKVGGSLWLGHSGDGQQSGVNPNVKVQKPGDEDGKGEREKDLGELASSKENEIKDLSVDHKDDVKIAMQNATYGRSVAKDAQVSKENGDGLSIRGRRSFIGANESKRNKSEPHAITQTEGQTEKSQMKADWQAGSGEDTRFKSKNHSTDDVKTETNMVSGRRTIYQETKIEADTMDEDDAEAEVDTNGSEADQDYKDE